MRSFTNSKTFGNTKGNIYKYYYLMFSMEEENINLNENDKKLLGFCYNKKRSIGEIAKYLKIAPKNVSVRLEKLINAKLIFIERGAIGKKVYVRTKQGNKIKEYFLEILKEIKRRGGLIDQDEYFALIPFNYNNPEDQDKFRAPIDLLYTGYIDKKIFMTEKGKKFLEENSNETKENKIS